jgi:hypothetical protein
VDGALLFADSVGPGVELLLVGPVDLSERLLAERGAPGRFELVPASQVVGNGRGPGPGGCAPSATRRSRVAARLVRDGRADAVRSPSGRPAPPWPLRCSPWAGCAV